MTDVMASTNSARWWGHLGSSGCRVRSSFPDRPLLLKSQGPNELHLPRRYFDSFVWSSSCTFRNCVSLRQDQFRPHPPPLRPSNPSPVSRTTRPTIPEPIPRLNVHCHPPTLRSRDYHRHAVRTHQSHYHLGRRCHHLPLRPRIIPLLATALVPAQALPV
jgi:hypothetical protein